MKLYTTPLSHFARKARLLLDFYSAQYEIIDPGNVAESDPKKFGGNPMMSVPVLVDGGTWLIESDHINSYLVKKLDPSDKLKVLSEDPMDLNIKAIINGIMTNEVKIILAKRTSVPVDDYSYFKKSYQAIEQGFIWLEANSKSFSLEKLTYLELHLICLWDHIRYYDLVNLSPYKKLSKIVDRYSNEPFILKSSPFVLKPK